MWFPGPHNPHPHPRWVPPPTMSRRAAKRRADAAMAVAQQFAEFGKQMNDAGYVERRNRMDRVVVCQIAIVQEFDLESEFSNSSYKQNRWGYGREQ